MKKLCFCACFSVMCSSLELDAFYILELFTSQVLSSLTKFKARKERISSENVEVEGLV